MSMTWKELKKFFADEGVEDDDVIEFVDGDGMEFTLTEVWRYPNGDVGVRME